MSASLFNKKTICLITGVTRGLGKTIAIEFSHKFENSLFILISRNKNAQEITKNEMNSKNLIKCNIADFANAKKENFELEIKKSLEGIDISKYEQAMIVHNASSLEFIDSHLDRLEDSAALQNNWMVNMTSPIVLNSVFFRLTSALTQRTIVCISSLCAIEPFKSWAIYCAGKAARDMLFSVLAAEDPTYRILNYAPGPLNTQMQVDARTKTLDSDLKDMFIVMNSENKLLETSETVRKLLHILTLNEFKSGSHLDYYDIDI